MMKDIKKTKVILIIITTITLVLLCGYIWIFFEISKFESRLSADKSKSKDLHLALDTINRMQNNIKTTISKRDLLFGYFIPSENLVGFIEQIERIIKNSGSFGLIDTVTEKPYDLGNQKFNEVSIFINLQGSWSEVLKSVALFELLPYKVSISNLNLSAVETLDLSLGSIKDNQKINKDKLWKASLTLNVISLK